MKLKSLELVGFKSFAKKTKIDFPNGLTEIVGPNGSGKSNVIEAIRWALGEQSAKNLRSNKMSDVIFSGSQGHPALDRARVSLLFDNSDHYLKTKFTEVRISRQIYRDGTSYYYLNGKECRLRDLQKLFMNSGIGSGSFAIISQDQVQQIFQSKPEDRRFIIETAAGIYRYKAQKHAAQTKLKRTRDNLARVTDIGRELKDRLTQLKSQREQAQVYLKAKKHLQALKLKQQSLKVSVCRAHFQLTQKKLQENHTHLAVAKRTVHKYQTSQQHVQAKVQKFNQQSEDLQAKLLKIVQKVDAVNNQQKLDEQKLEFTKQSIQHDQNQLTKVKVHLETLQATQKANQPKLKQQRTRVNALQRKLVATDDRSVTQKLEHMRDQVSHLQSDYVQKIQKQNDLENQINNYQQGQQNRQARLATITDQQAQLKATAQKLHATAADQQQQTQAIQTKVTHVQTELKSQRQQQERLQNVVNQLQNNYQPRFRAYQARVAQARGLERLMNNHSDLYYGVRNLLQHAQEFPGILGPVAKFLHVPGTYVKAIETTLRGQLQQVVVKTPLVAKHAINFLKQQRLGRVTFLPLNAVQPRWISQQLIQQTRVLPGLIGVAADLVQMPAEFETVKKHLLGNVLVAKDLSSAIQISRRLQHRYRIVTLDGELINAGGAITGGRDRHVREGLLTREYQAQRLQKELEQTQRSLQSDQTTLHTKQQKLQNMQQSQIQLQNTLNHLEQQAFVQQTKVKHQKHLVHEQVAKRQSLMAAKQKLQAVPEQSSLTALKATAEKHRNGLAETSLTIKQLQQKIKKQAQVVAKQQKAVQLLREKYLNQKNAYQNQQHQQHSIVTEIQQAQAEVQQDQQQLQTAQQQVKALDTKVKSFVTSQSVQNKLDQIKKHRHIVQSHLHKVSYQLTQVEQNIYQAQNHLVQLQTQGNRYQMQADKLKQQVQALQAQLPADTKPVTLKITEAQKALRNLSQRYRRVQAQFQELGLVNLKAIEEYAKVNKRYTFLHDQIDDLTSSKQELINAMDNMNSTIRIKFKRTFDAVNRMFHQTYEEIFVGGKAKLTLTDPQHLLTTGINIMAQPPGKRYRNMELLSGGERALTAIALLFAIIRIRPVPFCILDEAESALDLVNVSRFAKYIQKLKRQTQFIVITHRKETMLYADNLYGITMQESGISKLIGVNLRDMKKKG